MSFFDSGFFDGAFFDVVVLPSLSSLTTTEITQTGARHSLTISNAAAGALYLAVYPSAAPTPTWDRIAGWSGSPVYTDADASPTTSGSYTFTPDSSGLTASTSYVWYAVWDDGTDTVGPVASGSFNTLAGLQHFTLDANPSSLGLASNPTELLPRRLLTAEEAVCTVNAAAAATTVTRRLSADSASYALGATEATLRHTRALSLSAEPAALSTSAIDAVLTHTQNRTLSADPVGYTTASTTAATLHGRAVQVAAAGYAVGAFDATLIHGTPHRVLAADASSIVVGPEASALVTARSLSAGATALSATTSNATLYRGRALQADASDYALTAFDAELVISATDRVLSADEATALIQAFNAGLLWSGANAQYLRRSVFTRIDPQQHFAASSPQNPVVTLGERASIFTRVQ